LTPEDRTLDPDFFLTHQPLILYRLARARYANLSGIGAALAPGRWNRSGEEAIYTSTEIGVPLLERLAHSPKDQIPSNLAMMKILVKGNWAKGNWASDARTPSLIDPQTVGCLWIYKSLAAALCLSSNSEKIRCWIRPFRYSCSFGDRSSVERNSFSAWKCILETCIAG
jgi:hypothetical protein